MKYRAKTYRDTVYLRDAMSSVDQVKYYRVSFYYMVLLNYIMKRKSVIWGVIPHPCPNFNVRSEGMDK